MMPLLPLVSAAAARAAGRAGAVGAGAAGAGAGAGCARSLASTRRRRRLRRDLRRLPARRWTGFTHFLNRNRTVTPLITMSIINLVSVPIPYQKCIVNTNKFKKKRAIANAKVSK